MVEAARREYGLQSPNGTTHWDSFIERPITTEQERAVLAQVLHQFALELGWPPDEFVDRYKWTSRVVTPENVTFSLTDPSVTDPSVTDPSVTPPEGPGIVPDQLPPPEPIRATGE